MRESNELDIPKTVKKSAIGWIVPAFLMLICLGILAFSRAQVQDMLVNYQTKEQATQLEVEHNRKETTLQDQQAIMQNTLNSMDKKLDHLQFVLDYNHSMSPKLKDQQ